MYVRGNKDDYNKWGMSNPGWSNDDVMPYFTKSENTIVSPQDYLFHGHDGKLHTENINELSQMAQLLLSAAEERGYNIVDYNGKNQIGFGPIQSTTHNGQRHSTAKAFIDKERTNLKVSTESFVVQILIENNVAYGVKYIKEGRTRCDRATKEVILSAGVFNSPQLLMLAGIGPREHLNSLGIKVIQDLPVGKNMWDHTVSSASIFTINLTLPQYDQDENIKQYKEGHGLFTVPVNVQVVGFENVTSHDANVPDVEHVIAVTKPPYVSWEKVNKYNNIGLDVYNNINKKMAEQTIWQSYTFLLHPKSRGTVTLKSNDPMDYPQIDPNIFSDPEGSDINTLAASMKQLMQMSNTKALQQVNSQPMEIDLPNCKNFSHGTDEHIKCILRHTAFSLGHYSGTCKMGPISDKSSVVGNDLKVHGIESLRVADCSVIPVTTSGHTNAVAIMIGEKAADLMKKKWIG